MAVTEADKQALARAEDAALEQPEPDAGTLADYERTRVYRVGDTYEVGLDIELDTEPGDAARIRLTDRPTQRDGYEAVWYATRDQLRALADLANLVADQLEDQAEALPF